MYDIIIICLIVLFLWWILSQNPSKEIIDIKPEKESFADVVPYKQIDFESNYNDNNDISWGTSMSSSGSGQSLMSLPGIDGHNDDYKEWKSHDSFVDDDSEDE